MAAAVQGGRDAPGKTAEPKRPSSIKGGRHDEKRTLPSAKETGGWSRSGRPPAPSGSAASSLPRRRAHRWRREGFPGAYVSHPAEHRLPQREQVVDAHGPA